MAYIDVKDYFKQVEHQYFQMVSMTKAYEAELKKSGNMANEEQFNNAKAMVDTIKNNYDRLVFIMYLFDMPKDKNNKKKYEKRNKHVSKYTAKANSQHIIQENEDALKELKKILKLEEEKK